MSGSMRSWPRWARTGSRHPPSGSGKRPRPEPDGAGCAEPGLIDEAIELRRVVADDLLAGGLGQVTEFALDVFLRIRPHPVGMREIRAPHDVVLAELLQQLHADRVSLIGGVALAAPALARLHLEVQALELVLPLG